MVVFSFFQAYPSESWSVSHPVRKAYFDASAKSGELSAFISLLLLLLLLPLLLLHSPPLLLSSSYLTSFPPTVGSRSTVEKEMISLMNARWMEWEASFRSVFYQLRNNLLDYFYFVSEQFCVLFVSSCYDSNGVLCSSLSTKFEDNFQVLTLTL
jgi:hypothetical protein